MKMIVAIIRPEKLGDVLKALYRAEQTPLHQFGLSHFLVLRRKDD